MSNTQWCIAITFKTQMQLISSTPRGRNHFNLKLHTRNIKECQYHKLCSVRNTLLYFLAYQAYKSDLRSFFIVSCLLWNTVAASTIASVNGAMVSIAAFQAVDPGSIPSDASYSGKGNVVFLGQVQERYVLWPIFYFLVFC